MTKFFSADEAGSYVHKRLPGVLRVKYSIMQVHYIVEGIMEYQDCGEGDPDDLEEMLTYVVDVFGALTDDDMEFTIDDLSAINEKLEQYYEDDGDGEEDEDEEDEDDNKMPPEDFAKVLNQALAELGIEQIADGKLYTYPRVDGKYIKDGQFQIRIDNEEEHYGLAIGGIKVHEEEGKPETVALAGKLSAMLPDLSVEIAGAGNISLSVKGSYFFSPLVSPEMLKRQLYSIFGCCDIMTNYMQKINNNEMQADAVMNELQALQAQVTALPVNISAFEQQVHEYISQYPYIEIVKHDAENHNFLLKYSYGKGDAANAAVGVVTLLPLLRKIMVTVPYYQGDIKAQEDEITEWCDSRSRHFVSGYLVSDPDSGYVWFRNVIDMDTVDSSETFYSVALESLEDDVPYFAHLFHKLANGATARQVTKYEDNEYDDGDEKKTNIKISLPDDLRKIGIYGSEMERLLLAFTGYGEAFYSGKRD